MEDSREVLVYIITIFLAHVALKNKFAGCFCFYCFDVVNFNTRIFFKPINAHNVASLPEDDCTVETKQHDLILILDFGSQYTQLIARRIREAGVYCEILPFNAPLAKIQQLQPMGIILSGGPSSVYDAKAPKLDA